MPDDNPFGDIKAQLDETEQQDAQDTQDGEDDESATDAQQPTETEDTEASATPTQQSTDDEEGEDDTVATDTQQPTDTEDNEYAEHSPPFPFSTSEQGPIYPHEDRWDEWEDAKFEAETYLREFGLRNPHGREFDDALLQLAIESPEQLGDIILEARGIGRGCNKNEGKETGS